MKQIVKILVFFSLLLLMFTTVKKNRDEADHIMGKYSDRIPIIVKKSPRAGADIPNIDKHKFLVPSDLTLGQFQYVIRKRLNLSQDKALMFFINGYVFCTSDLIIDIYEKSHDIEDGFLYIIYSGESTFG